MLAVVRPRVITGLVRMSPRHDFYVDNYNGLDLKTSCSIHNWYCCFTFVVV